MRAINSHVSRIKSKTLNNLFLVSGEDDKRDCWYFLDVNQLKVPMFEKVAKDHQVQDLTSWGKIIISGWGDMPPNILKEKIIEKGADHGLSKDELKQEIFFLTNDQNGRPFYTFIMVPNYLTGEFTKNCDAGNFDYKDYGSIVESDWGEPGDEVIDYMSREYNVSRCTVENRLKQNRELAAV